MTIVLEDITTICRFCLSDDEVLFPIHDILDSGLTSEDIERCTGIQVCDKFNISYTVCIECHNKLQKFAMFRSCCLNNDLRFRLRFPTIFEDVLDEEEPCEKEWAVELNLNEAIDVQHNETTDHSYCVEVSENSQEQANMEVNLQEGFVLEYENFVEQIYEADEHEEIEEVEEIVEEVVVPSGELIETISQESNEETLSEEFLHETQETQIQEANFEEEDKQDPERRKETHDPREQQTFNDESQLYVMEESKTDSGASIKTTQGTKMRKKMCPQCGKLVSSLKDHMLSHTKEQRFACELCSFVSSRKANLKTHVLNVHQKRVVRRCEKCDRGFSYIDSYKAHMRAKHNVGEHFECKICGMKFRHRGGLNGHLNRKHNEESNCSCPICGFVCQDKKGLKDHARVHSNEKPFVCRLCPKGFKSPYARRTHELIHQGVTFSCAMCEKSYRYKSQLVLHAKKHHPQQDTKEDETSQG